MDQLMYSKEQVAALLGISKHTVTRDVSAGRIRAVKYGNRVLVPKNEIKRLCRNMRPRKPTEPRAVRAERAVAVAAAAGKRRKSA